MGAKCLETRMRRGMKWRRYKLEDGRTTTTYELPQSVVHAIGITRVEECLARFQRGELERSVTHRINELVLAGWKPEAIAHELGVTRSAVEKRRRILKSQQPLSQV